MVCIQGGGSSRSGGGEDSGDSGCGLNAFANRAEGPESSISTKASDQQSFDYQKQPQFLQAEMATSDSPAPGGNADQPPPKHPTQDKVSLFLSNFRNDNFIRTLDRTGFPIIFFLENGPLLPFLGIGIPQKH